MRYPRRFQAENPLIPLSEFLRPALSVNGVTFTGGTNEIDNDGGMFNTAITLTATNRNHVVNRAGGTMNQLILSAPRNIIDNQGTLNNGLQFTGSGVNAVNNYASGVINSITSSGNAQDQIRNDGIINGNVSLGAGSDWYINIGDTSDPLLLGGIDILYIQNGSVSSTVNMGNGDDFAAILNGHLSANFQAGAGEDKLHWAGGTVTAGIDMGDDDDRAVFYDLTQSNLSTGIQISGGAGDDSMSWHNTIGDDVYRYLNWELIELENGSNMIFSNYSTLRLGDAGTSTGALTIDASSRISAGNGTHTISPFTGGDLVTVANAGLIDLTNANNSVTDRFVINGNYIGQSGNLSLQTYLGDDSSPSDQLVIQGNGARASGVTLLNITNVNGPGAQTIANGIRVVDADLAGGATTDTDSFMLGAPVGAGIYEYQLFQGGVGADAGDNDWYLRSVIYTEPTPITTLPAPAPPVTAAPLPPLPIDPLPPTIPVAPLPPITVTPPTTPPTGVTPTVPVAPGIPTPLPVGPGTPIIRPEIPGYTMTPAITQQMGLAALDKFHARHGDEGLIQDETRGWGRIFGQASEQSWSPTIAGLDYQLAPKFEGRIWGIQVGQDIFGVDHEDGSRDRAGLSYTHTAAQGDTIGNTLAQIQVESGRLDLTGDALGVYWNRVKPDSWYVDTVAMATWINGDAHSDRGIGADMSGMTYLASLEGRLCDAAWPWMVCGAASPNHLAARRS
jgi:hypothetical protein